ncbi:uncharacterized protein METZ01_LOCUS383441 [marine metagenome]|uniref:Uncharacterized protein n=1 Tax=marine metagenome TaxID=408172 RepID=A0A382U9B3_9ZZZZ
MAVPHNLWNPVLRTAVETYTKASLIALSQPERRYIEIFKKYRGKIGLNIPLIPRTLILEFKT